MIYIKRVNTGAGPFEMLRIGLPRKSVGARLGRIAALPFAGYTRAVICPRPR